MQDLKPFYLGLSIYFLGQCSVKLVKHTTQQRHNPDSWTGHMILSTGAGVTVTSLPHLNAILTPDISLSTRSGCLTSPAWQIQVFPEILDRWRRRPFLLFRHVMFFVGLFFFYTRADKGRRRGVEVRSKDISIACTQTKASRRHFIRLLCDMAAHCCACIY